MGTIGTVLMPQMQEKTIYVSDDGQRFDTPEDCQLWERLVSKHDRIMDVALNGWGGSGDETAPKKVQQFLKLIDFDVDTRLFTNKGSEFIRHAKLLKATTEWLWNE